MKNREKKVAKLKQGGGVFKYVGGAYDSEFIPGIQAVDPDGNPMKDKRSGKPVWVKEPKMIKRELDAYPPALRELSEEELAKGVEPRKPRQSFPLGVEVAVNDPRLALKLRCLPFMEELPEEPAKAVAAAFGLEASGKSAEKPKRGRPSKSEASPEE